MANFQVALGYKLYVKARTNPATALQSNTTGMTLLGAVSNAPINTTTDTQSAQAYDDELGFRKEIASGASWSIPVEMLLDQLDAGYAILKTAADGAVAGQYLEIRRESPIPAAAVGNTGAAGEIYRGVVTVTNFSESIDAGAIATVSFTMQGYGAYTYTAAALGTPPP